MSVQWTKAQTNAINARKGSVLVSAAAGSGKTAVLVERIIRAVCDPVNPVSLDRMLIVTFTRAASAEMRARIEKALTDKLKNDPDNKYLLAQRQLLYSARISTIDSFCVDFVRQYFFKLGIQNDFRIADDAELDILVNKALDNTLEFFYKQNDKSFLDLVSAVCTYKSDDNLRNFIKKTYSFLSAVPFPEKWYDNTLNLYDVSKCSFEDTPYFDYLVRYLKDSVSYMTDINLTAIRYVEQCETIPEEYSSKYKDTLVDDSRLLLELYNSCENASWDEIKSFLDLLKFKRMPSVKKGICDEEKEYISSSRKQYTDTHKKLRELFASTCEAINQSTEEAFPVVKAFIDCVRRFSEELFALKLEKNVLGFSDVSSLMVKLLYDYNDGEPVFSDTAREISEQFDAVMVDEFQDINEVQDIIFTAVCGSRNNLFVVGDVKQSIYAFRQAKPQIFINYKDKYPRYSESDEVYPSKIILDKNFRSSLGVTQAVNDIFRTLMMKQTGGIEYNDEEKLVCGTDYPRFNTASMELMLISSENINPEKNETELSLEAVRVAERIYKLVHEEKPVIKDGGEEREVCYGDIAILLRSPKGMSRRAVTFIETLNRYGIPTVSDEKSSFFDANEIKIMLNVLRVIDNPIQDIPVLSVVMSPLFGFSPDVIADIRADYRKMPVYTAIQKSAQKYPLCREFVEFIDKMRTLACTTTVDRLISIIIRTTGFESVTMAINGEPAKNLYLLEDYARSFAANGYKTLSAFINFIDRIKENETELNAGSDLNDETANAVHIKSIHKSKGLEYPVCFVCCTGTEFNLDDTRQSLIVDADYGAGFRLKKGYLKYDSIQRKTLSMLLKDNQMFEEIRVLYVALTRAKQKLIVSCVKNDPEGYLRSLESKMPVYPITPYVVKNAKSFSDWLFMCALANPNCVMPRENIEPDYLGFGKDSEPWDFSIIRGEYRRLSNKKIKKSKTRGIELDKEFLLEFEKRVRFKYPFKPLSTLPQKVSASELAHKDNKLFNKLLRRPEFTKDSKSDGAERGTAFHAFMERCDLKAASIDSGAEAERLLNNGFITERQLDLLDYKKLDDFLRGELIRRVINSESAQREYTFTVEINAEDYTPEIEPEFAKNKIVMQGAIDLLFIENGEAVIVDYKTDRVKDSQKLIEMYRKQLELYRNAVETITKLNVREVLIYSVYNNEIISIN